MYRPLCSVRVRAVLSFIAERAVEDAPALVRPGGETMTFGRLAMASTAVMQAIGARVGEVARRVVGVAVDDAAGFFASVLAVLEAGGVVMPLDLRKGTAALELEAARAHALAVIVGDAADNRLDVVAVNPSRRELPAEACLILDAGGRHVVHGRVGLGVGVDAIARQVGLDASSRLALVGAPANASLLLTALATLRVGGALHEESVRAPNVASGSLADLLTLAGTPLARVVLVGDGDVAALRSAFRRRGSRACSIPPRRCAWPRPKATNRWRRCPTWCRGRAKSGSTCTRRRRCSAISTTPRAPAPRSASATANGSCARGRSAASISRRSSAPSRRRRACVSRPCSRCATGWASGSTSSSPATRRRCRPRHPARVVALESLPHAADGSVNRQALRRMAAVDSARFLRYTDGMALVFEQLFDPESSTYTYLVGDEDGKVAALIDPVIEQLDRDLARVAAHGFRLVHTIETHVHADHVTGGGALGEQTGSMPVVHRDSPVTCEAVRLAGGDTLRLGALVLTAIETPGHTPESMSFLLTSSDVPRVFTGDALLIGTCGRTDFQGGNPGQLFDSIHGRLFTLPDETLVFPGARLRGARVVDDRRQKRGNARLAGKSRDEFIALMNHLGLPPPEEARGRAVGEPHLRPSASGPLTRDTVRGLPCPATFRSATSGCSCSSTTTTSFGISITRTSAKRTTPAAIRSASASGSTAASRGCAATPAGRSSGATSATPSSPTSSAPTMTCS